ncbi:hypothetical protein [Thermodesulfovibrio hydrogeniphilus]
MNIKAIVVNLYPFAVLYELQQMFQMRFAYETPKNRDRNPIIDITI